MVAGVDRGMIRPEGRSRRGPQMSATPDSALANPELLIADLQGQLAQCRAERDEALQRETATAEVLQVINSSPGDLAPVFDAILEKALRLCGAAYGHVFRVEGDLGRAVAARGDPEFVEWLLKQGPVRPTPDGILHRMMQGERVVQIPDSTDTDAYRAGSAIRELIDRSGVRTTLAIALRNHSALLGSIFVNRREVRPFSDREIALLQNFAAQAVIAMDNARLLTETREALEQQTATAEVLQVINSSPGDLAPVFDAILEKAHSLCGVEYGTLQLHDGEKFRILTRRGFPETVGQSWRDPYSVEPNSPLRALLEGEPLAEIPDVIAYQAKAPNPRAEAAIAVGIRSVLFLPLRRDNLLLGVISAGRKDAKPFRAKEVALLQNFAAQAVIAMENARLLTETREALEQQTATAEVLQVINSSPGDLAPVFDAMLEKALRLCEAAFGIMNSYDGEQYRAVATRGLPEALAQLLQTDPPPPGRHNPLRRVADGEDLVHVVDFREDASYQEGNPRARALADMGDARSLAIVALRKDARLLGTITVFRQEVRPFTDKQITLLQNFAAQAVIAMENARLLTETREALEQQTATAEVLQVINSSPGNLARVFDAMLEKATRICGTEGRGSFWSFDGRAFQVLASTIGDTGRTLQPGPGTALWRIARGESVVQIADVETEHSYRVEPVEQMRTRLAGARTALAVALRKDGVLLGAITAFRQEVRPFTDKQIALLQNFAAQAVIAMENTRLLGELRQRTDEVAELNRGLETRVAEQVEELGRVGRLKRFLAPQLAELIVSQGDEKILESHRRDSVVVFCDLRGYTAFTETAEPEEVLDFLREYHGALGPLVSQFEGTLDQFSGDGIMVFFNDPVPCPDPAGRAVKMAMAMREEAGKLIATWRRHGCELGFGAGIAQGYATLGQIGFSERSGYTAIGTVCNLAARLCAEAKDGQILVSSRIAEAVEAVVKLEDPETWS
jgi:GAF domain-containing protein